MNRTYYVVAIDQVDALWSTPIEYLNEARKILKGLKRTNPCLKIFKINCTAEVYEKRRSK